MWNLAKIDYCSAFLKDKLIAQGKIEKVALVVKKIIDRNKSGNILFFDDLTGQQFDLNLSGSDKEIIARIENEKKIDEIKGPGRPKLGVVSKEITLLPRHWEWLSNQPGGASVTIRKLVEDAKKRNSGQFEIREVQDATYRFMSALAGNLPEYEEAIRVFYAKDFSTFKKLIKNWPKDIRSYIHKLAKRILN